MNKLLEMVITTIIIGILFFTFVILSTKWIIKSSTNAFEGLDALKAQCLEIKNKEDFQKCLDEFKRLQKISFHRHHYMELHEIYGILKAKTHDHVNNNATNA